MLDNGLPQAKSRETYKVGRFVIKTEKPSESRRVIERSIKDLEKAAQEKVFIDNVEQSN